MPSISGIPKEIRINLDSRKTSTKIENLLSLLLKEIDNAERQSKGLIPETRVVLRNGTAVGRIENNELKVFDRHKGSQMENTDEIAIIFPVSGG